MQLLRPDMSTNNAGDRALISVHQLLRSPTTLLIGPDGKERRAERVIGELRADEFLSRLARARQGV